MGTTITGTQTATTSAAGSTPPREADAATVARSGSSAEVAAFARAHPDQRAQLDDALIARGRYGDVFALAQADRAAAAGPTGAADKGKTAKPDYDTPFWTRTRYGDGPTYRARPQNDPTWRISSSSAWDGPIGEGKVSASEKRVVSRMSDNEGRLDSVQSWDNQLITAGAMQKTVNAGGTGELAQQIYDFSQSDPDAYKSLFSDKGWAAEHTGKGTQPGDYTMSFTPADGKALTGKALSDYIKDPDKPDQWSATMGPLHDAGHDPAFQTKQMTDYVARLDTAVGKTPKSAVKGTTYDHPISDYVTSEQGAALVLDESVNRPGHVAGTFGRALDSFHAARPKAERDPTKWTTEQRAEYEPEIVRNYMAQREQTNMTDPKQRAGHIVGRGTPLSADPGSFTRVAR